MSIRPHIHGFFIVECDGISIGEKIAKLSLYNQLCFKSTFENGRDEKCNFYEVLTLTVPEHVLTYHYSLVCVCVCVCVCVSECECVRG